MADGGDFDRAFGHASILDGMDDPGCRHENDQNDEHGNYSPGELNLIAAICLWRLGSID